MAWFANPSRDILLNVAEREEQEPASCPLDFHSEKQLSEDFSQGK